MCWAALIGAGISAAGQMKQGQATAKDLKYQAALNKYNAHVAGMEAKTAEKVGQRKVSDFLVKGNIFAGAQTATAGASGVVGGSQFDVEMDTARGIQADAAKIKADYLSKKRAHLRARDLYLLEADVNERRAKGALEAGFLGGAGSVARGAGDAYGDYKQSSYYSQGAA